MKLKYTGLAVALVTIAATTGLATASPAASCDDTVSPGESIQAAIDAASAGDTICVEPGTYDENINVNKDVTVRGNQSPMDNPATVNGTVDVSADGATFAKMRVAPATVFESGGLDPHGILVTASNTKIYGNLVEDLKANSTGGSVTINGIQVWNDGPSELTDVVIKDNTVREMSNEGNSTWPNYGGVAAIKVQGVLNGVDVKGNNVKDIHSAGWAYGIVTTHTGNAPGISPKDVEVMKNDVRKVNDGSVYDVFADPNAAPYPGAAFAIDGDSLANETVVNFNNLVNPLAIQNKDQDHTLDAENNYYGHASGPAARTNPAGKQVGQGGDILGLVDWQPYLNQPFQQTPEQKAQTPERGPK